MFRRKTAILFAIIGIATILGFIIGVAPGYFIKGYGLFAIGGAFIFVIFLLLIISTIIYEYLNKHQVLFTASTRGSIFHQGLSRSEKIMLSLTNSTLFFGGALLGVICELLLKAISAPIAVHLIIAALFIAVLLAVLVIILAIELKKSKHPKQMESNPVLTSAKDRPRTTTLTVNPSYSRPPKSTWQDASMNSPMINTNPSPRPLSTIQREYQKLLQPSARFHINEKVFVHDHDVARIIGTEGLGIYRIQYLDNGLVENKTGAELRKALSLIE